MRTEPGLNVYQKKKDYTLNEETLRQHAASKLQKMNDYNIASIAFVWEHQGHRILFMGDADPIQVSNAIENVYKEKKTKKQEEKRNEPDDIQRL